MKPSDEVLADALRLDAKARAEIAAELLASLDGPPDPDAESAWEAEIQRRVADIEAWTAELEPWEKVKRRIEREILDRSPGLSAAASPPPMSSSQPFAGTKHKTRALAPIPKGPSRR
ncbi:hypothetical protein LIP_0993 [Limnochorda pilosa]|uniref:Addiction module protein n=2 Tax=Limnochorda pilosa TaxID=1555112 RepID=A0A0K2SID7_LIMPI|nr:hypothetical protein LIP_0993 [Limnochorda pilosa]